MKIKNIIFDFDGVLCESVDIKTEAFYEMYLSYGDDIASKVRLHHLQNGGMSRFDKFNFYEQELLKKEITQSKIDKLSEVFSNLVLTKVIEAPLVEGVNNFLKSYAENYNCFIVSATPMEEMKKICKEKSIDSYFNAIFGSPKSKIDWVKEILLTNKLNKSETLFIGDAMSDYTAAKENNIHFLLRRTQNNKNIFTDKNMLSINDFVNLERYLKRLSDESRI
ncbi:MAG: Haloacid dehalogenase-like hydrolase putative [uncultured Sulfurovum sp.]|uniref:phosphoglycolate phosphatase n=1 Tax=uncultured Sulfurovum sp. TaxID=269237 RepID=A0A6S6SQE9_9BACT|nr:MAG: Haloacid dehalogenase-like hydrolase putative [uncultured Sulfurovum sp.]